MAAKLRLLSVMVIMRASRLRFLEPSISARYIGLTALALLIFATLSGCGSSGNSGSVQAELSASTPPAETSTGTPGSAGTPEQAILSGSFTCPRLAAVVSATGLTTFTKSLPGGHAVNKNDGQIMDTCAYSDSAQTATINVMLLSFVHGFTYARAKSNMRAEGRLTAVGGLGSEAFELTAPPADSAGFSNNCHLVVDTGSGALLQIVAGAESDHYSALCSQAEAVARLIMR
jgi:hypothetical protein